MRHRFRGLGLLVSYLALLAIVVQGCAQGSSSPPASTSAPTAAASAPTAAPAASPTAATASATTAAAAPTTAPTTAASPAASASTSPVDSVQITKPVEITLWHTQTQQNKTTLEKIINDFNNSHPNIKVKPEFIDGYGNVYKKTMAAIAGGGLPDMAVAYEDMVADYMDANAVVPLGPYINSAKYGLTKQEIADYVPAFWNANKYPQFNNQMLSFPFTKSMLVMYYNQDLMTKAGIKEPPQTWSQFQSDCNALKKINVKCYALSVDASTIDAWIYSRGGTLLSPDQKTATFNSQAGYDSLSLIQNLVKQGEAYQISKQYADQTDFGAQRTAFTFGTTAGLEYYKQAVNGKFKWGVAIIPHAQGVKPVTVLYGADIAIFHTTPEKQLAAWEFVKYFTSPKVTAEWAAASNYAPVRLSAMKDPVIAAKFKSSPQYATAVTEILPNARPEPYVKGWQATRTYLENALVAVINGQAEPKAALDQAAQKANTALAKQ